MIFSAHITEIQEKKIIQSVKEHCVKTAEYASGSLKTIGLGDTAYLAGVLHDFGKYTSKYKRYLEDAFEGKAIFNIG